MLFRRSLVLTFLLAVSFGLRAQDVDFLKHRKAFDICSIKRMCAQCYTCNQERCLVRIQNKSDKKITGIYYKFYSPVFNKIVEKEAKVEGNKIPGKETGEFYICVYDVRHWIISKIEYDDESVINYVLHDRMENFLQEADECDCNLTTH